MKILSSKMYNKEMKDSEIFVRFTDKEMNTFVKQAGFIQEEYFCMTSFSGLEHLGQRAGNIYIGMEHNKKHILGFYLEHKWNVPEDEKYFEISLVEHKKTYTYNDDISLQTLQKKFMIDIIKDGYLKYN